MAVGTFDGGWTGEAAIPFKSISYGPGNIWGFNARRINMWKNEISYLTDLPAGRGTGGILQPSFGAPMVGIEAPPNSRTIDIKPYAILDVTTSVPANIRNDASGDAGLDARVSITPNLNADFTVNTDFAQVEADEQQVNLTRFSLFFPEKREFFLENAGLFSFGGSGGGGPGNTPTLFYSRRIGLEAGQAIPIRAGGRVTGRIGEYAVGLINMYTGAGDALGVPGTNFTVARVRRDILRRSSVGAIATVRSDTGGRLGTAATYGVDGSFSFNDVLDIDTYWGTVDNPGIADSHNSYRVRVQYDDDLYDAQLDHVLVEKNFVPEVGFVRRTDMRRTFVTGSYNPRPASIAAIRQFRFTAAAMQVENGKGIVEDRRWQVRPQIQFESGDSLQATYAPHDFEVLPFDFEVSDGITVPAGPYEGGDVQLTYQLGQQRRVSGSLRVQRRAFYGGTNTEFAFTSGRVEVHPQLSIEPALEFNSVETPFGDFTAELVTARVTYTITPLMFISSLQQYNSANASLSTNVRLRWEYLPGSELFIVYNEGRTTEGDRIAQLHDRSFVVKVNRLFRF